jgi:hypothetical protein
VQQQRHQQQQAKQQSKEQQQDKQQWVQKLSKRPATPGGALGKPISIFSSDGSKQCSKDEADEASGSSSGSSSGTEQQQLSPSKAATDAREQQQWHHKLSNRPPTPGVSLGKPVSIFSSSGNEEEELAQSEAAAAAQPAGACLGSGVVPGPSASVATAPVTPARKSWASKLSKRPPTPGVGENSC